MDSIEEINLLSRKIIRIAQHESELDLGVNPASFEQAKTSYLSEKDFEYISRILVLVEKKLNNKEWLAKTINDIEKRNIIGDKPIRGIRFDDELFRAGRGILESYLKDKK